MRLLPVAERGIAELDRSERAAAYINDPVLWMNDILGLQPWSKQRQILESIRDNRATAVAAGHGVGKDLPLDTPLPTPSGWTTMGEVQPGDYVLDEMGRPTRVLTKSEVFNHEQYRIEFANGDSIIASGTHLWNVIPFSTAKRLRRRGVADWREHWDATVTMSTREMMEAGVQHRNGEAETCNFLIPMHHALELPDADLPVDPYVFGAWLGDGTSTAARMTIGEDGQYIIEEFARRGYTLAKAPRAKYGYSFTRQGFVQALGEFDVVGRGKKHIPAVFLRASIAQRKELLRGIMDTDGFRSTGASFGVDFANERLANDVAELVRTLGGRVNVRAGDMYLGSAVVGTRYRLNFTLDFCPFTEGSYKAAGWTPSGNVRNTARYIKSITPVASVPSQCISVDSPRSLYLAGRGMIVTHNTYIAAVACMWWVDVHPPSKTFIASTAPTSDQVNLLWDNIRDLHTLMQERYEAGLIDHPPVGQILGDNKWKLPNGSLVGQGRKPPDEKSDVAFQGRHADYLLAIADEGVGVPEPLIHALSHIATGQYNRQLIIANPTDPSSAMGKIWSENNPAWHRMHISVYDSPMITNEPGFDLENAPGLSGWDFIEQAKNDYNCTCEDDRHENCDPRFIARVLGQWAFDAGDTIFTEADLARAINTVVVPDPEIKPVLGCDVAGKGADADASCIYAKWEGEVWETDERGRRTRNTGRRGFQIRRVAKWRNAPIVGSNPDNPSAVMRIAQEALAQGSEIVVIDASGFGKAVFDGLEDSGPWPFLGVEAFGSGATSDNRAYLNRRAEEYFRFKYMMARGEIDLDGDDEELFEELRALRFEHTDRAQLKVESKRDIRKSGRKSPDHADSAVYANWEWERDAGLPTGTVLAQELTDIEDYGLEMYRQRPGQPLVL